MSIMAESGVIGELASSQGEVKKGVYISTSSLLLIGKVTYFLRCSICCCYDNNNGDEMPITCLLLLALPLACLSLENLLKLKVLPLLIFTLLLLTGNMAEVRYGDVRVLATN